MTVVAAIQMVSGHDVGANLAVAAELISEAAGRGARLVALPENFALMARGEAERMAVAEADGSGPIQDFLAGQARRHRVWLIGGTMALKARTAHKLRAACLVYDEQGRRAARYDKIHLFDVQLPSGEQYRESASFEAGEAPAAVHTPVGRVGLAICYDLRFPELFRRLLDLGAEIFVVPSAFTATTGRAHWEVLVRARAVENLAYVIAPDQGGTHGNGRDTHGDSMIVGPWGDVRARLPRGAGVVVAEIDPTEIGRVRASLPSVDHRRIGVGAPGAES